MTPDKVEAALGVLRNTIRMSEAQADIDGGKKATQYQRGRAEVSRHTANELRDLLSVLTEALAERERDAARYRWLRERVGVDYSFGGYRAFMTCGNTELNPSATDESIDAAMKDTDHAR